MEKSKLVKRKAQSLPLNTIVIAILVIIVLVVIITFFVSNTAKTGEQLNQNSVSGCDMSNPALKALGYTDVKSETVSVNKGDTPKYTCDNGYEKIDIIPVTKEEKENNKIEYSYCCGKK
jgi:hypothetical protein